MFATEAQFGAIGRAQCAFAGTPLHQRRAQAGQPGHFAGQQGVVVVGAQHPAQAQGAFIQQGLQHWQIAAVRVHQHGLARVGIGQQVGHFAAGLVVQDTEQHVVPPVTGTSSGGPSNIRATTRRGEKRTY